MASITESLSAIARQFERLALDGTLSADERRSVPTFSAEPLSDGRGVLDGVLSTFPNRIVTSGSAFPLEVPAGSSGDSGVGTSLSAERLVQSLLGASGFNSSLLGGLLGGPLASSNGGPLGSLQEVAGQAAGGVLGGPLGLVAGALLSLFRSDTEPVSFPLFARPDAQTAEFDVARELDRRGSQFPSAQPAPAAPATGTGSPPVVIQVNALDARSFAEHRDDIATAVREALTRNHSLRDEIWED